MKSDKDVYHRIRKFVSKVVHSSPVLANYGLDYSFNTQFKCLATMQEYTLKTIRELFRTYKGKNVNSILQKDIDIFLIESIAFFEAYLNAFYSFIQIIGRLTPYFYDREKLKRSVPYRYFHWQIDYFLDNPDVDHEYSDYLKNNMTWYDELIFNRDAVSHNVSAFLGFGKKEIIFIDMPKRRIDFFESGKPTKKLEQYILENWTSLFEFLDFYVEHFSNRQIFVETEEEWKLIQEKIRKTQD